MVGCGSGRSAAWGGGGEGPVGRLSGADCVTFNKVGCGCGEMAEWLKAHAWKACIPQGIQGSNPCLSAICLRTFALSTGSDCDTFPGRDFLSSY